VTRTAIVTGSDSGIGKATAVAFGAAGYSVGVTWYADEDGGRQTLEELEREGGRGELRRLDLTDPERAGDVIDELADALGGLDVLVNNAGMSVQAPFLETRFEDWRTVLTTDLDGAFVCAQRAARRMVAQGRGGRIVNVTSVHQEVPLRNSAPYCAAKGGLRLLTKVMALELGEHGITVNNVAPGEISTPMNDAEDADVDEQPRPSIPLGRPGDAREVARLIVHLADERSSYTTGATYLVDGGFLLMAAVANE
jgi:NAD(P)-dependent dehydrogenase (short-subunit alcohol dehydrogenase family)